MKHIPTPIRLCAATAAFTLLACAATAQNQTPLPPIAGLSGDWNGDEMADLALLVPGGSDAEPGVDLVLYLGDGQGLQQVLRVQDVVFGGPMWGQTPGLQARSATSFSILSEQTAMGRSPWSQAVTVAWRNGAFVVAGFTHSSYDRIENTAARCDVNLLTGGWEVELTPADDGPARIQTGRDGPRAFALTDLSETYWPEVCARLID